MTPKRYPRQLSYGANNAVIALSETEAGKLFTGDTRSVHHDLKRPAGLPGLPYDNILLTPAGLRLIDVGISVLKHQVGQRFFDAHVQRELAELTEFRDYFVTR